MSGKVEYLGNIKVTTELDAGFDVGALMVKAYEKISFGYIDKRMAFAISDPCHVHAISAPHIWVPKLTIPEAVAMGAATAIIRNPVVTRRFWAGWLSPSGGQR